MPSINVTMESYTIFFVKRLQDVGLQCPLTHMQSTSFYVCVHPQTYRYKMVDQKFHMCSIVVHLFPLVKDATVS